jgi:murein L,D-transpeptidase YafK
MTFNRNKKNEGAASPLLGGKRMAFTDEALKLEKTFTQ